jgi:molecular chaperone Hsp33
MSAASGAPSLRAAPEPRRDVVYPFLIEELGVLGRLALLGPAVDSILNRHDYPAPVAYLLGETVALAAVLASSVKYKGVFTLQAQGDGPVRLLVADVTSEGHVRGYASLDRERFAALDGKSPTNPVPRLLGAGHLAFTVDQSRDTERYQGIVDLAGPTLAACAQHYFRQSEQIESVMRLAVKRPDKLWRAGAIVLQRLPRDDLGKKRGWAARAFDEEEREDGWRRVATRIGTLRDAELTDASLPVETLLYRLFPEDDVRLFRARPLLDRCRCSRERAAATLRMLPRDRMDEYKVNGAVVVTCQFCSRHERFDDRDLERLFAGAEGGER